MTDDLVKQAREALDGVTPGLWSVAEIPNVTMAVRAEYRDDQGRRITSFPFECRATIQGDMKANANFAAVAHDLLPAMADRIEALTAERDALRDRVKALEGQLAASNNMTDIRALEICMARMKWDKETQRILRVQLHGRRAALSPD